MMWLKSCPRCEKGDMYLDQDDSRHCMQCGYVQASGRQTEASARLAILLGFDGGKYDAAPAAEVDRAPALAT
jgi:hypothetical protein